MGLGFLFGPTTVLIFVGIVSILVLTLRLTFTDAFSHFGGARVALGYVLVVGVSFAAAAIETGSFREWVANALLASYMAVTFVTLLLLPL
jgi:hypothetical protein